MRVAIGNLADLPRLEAAQGPLAEAAAARLLRFATERRRRQGALARRLASIAASAVLGASCPVGEIEEDGRLSGVRVRSAPALSVSLSHRGELAVAACSAVRCGVDVEICRERDDLAEAAELAFGSGRAAWVLGVDSPSERQERFYLLWTLAESAWKAGTELLIAGRGANGHPLVARGGAPIPWWTRKLGDYRVTAVGGESTPQLLRG